MNNIKVLIVEDDQLISFLQKTLLRKNKITDNPLEFGNGKKALDFLLSECTSNKYLILLDLNMPEMNGWEFLDKLQKLDIALSTKVVVVTSSTDLNDRNKAKMYPVVSGYLEKPLQDLSLIFQTLEQMNRKPQS